MAGHGRLSVVLAFVLAGVSSTVVALRFYCRYYLSGKLTASDWVMLLALIAVWGSSVVNWYLILYMDYTQITKQVLYEEIASRSLFMFWIYRISYILDLCLIKTSILLFYRYIASSRKSYHHLVRVLLAVVLIGSASMIVASVFTCYPIGDSWSFQVYQARLSGLEIKQCYNPGPFWLANAAYNLVTDFMIWTLPIIFFLNLHTMARHRRFEFVATFSVGIVAIVASCARLRVIVIWISDYHHHADHGANLMIWSQVEQHTGIIAGSLLFLQPLFRKGWFSLKAKERVQPRAPPVMVGKSISDPIMPRPPIIPSPRASLESSSGEFEMPKEELAPIRPVKYHDTWGTTIWDGTQAHAMIPT